MRHIELSLMYLDKSAESSDRLNVSEVAKMAVDGRRFHDLMTRRLLKKLLCATVREMAPVLVASSVVSRLVDGLNLKEVRRVDVCQTE